MRRAVRPQRFTRASVLVGLTFALVVLAAQSSLASAMSIGPLAVEGNVGVRAGDFIAAATSSTSRARTRR